jgi:hypothetical protein
VAAAVQAEAVAEAAARIAQALRSDQPMPPAAVARLLVEANRMLGRLRRQERLVAPAPRTS